MGAWPKSVTGGADAGGPWYHGTHRKLRRGDLVAPGFPANDDLGAIGEGGAREHVYASTTHEMADFFADEAVRANPGSTPRVYVVQPTGPMEPDPELQEGGIEPEAYRSRHPVRVLREHVPPKSVTGAAEGPGPQDRGAMVPLDDLHGVASMNHPGMTLGDVWEYRHPEDEPQKRYGDEAAAGAAREQAALRGYAEDHGTVPGSLVTCSHGTILEDGEHRYMAARDAGLEEVRVTRARGCLMPELHRHRTAAARWSPSSGIFSATTGLDPRLFDEDRQLRPEVREAIMTRLDQALRADSGIASSDWQSWLRVYIAGGSASEWAGSRPNDEAQDLDVLIGADYDCARSHSPALSAMSDDQVTQSLNAVLRARFNDPDWHPPFGGAWSLTAYCNQAIGGGEDGVTAIRPYAAYDVTAMRWSVSPPHLPQHSLADFPRPSWRRPARCWPRRGPSCGWRSRCAPARRGRCGTGCTRAATWRSGRMAPAGTTFQT